MLYVRIAFGKKPTFRSLKTKLISIAVDRAKEIREEEKRKIELAEEGRQIHDKNCTVGCLVEMEMDEKQNDVAIKGSTVHYWTQIFAALEKSWPRLFSSPAKTVSAKECESWAKKYSTEVSATRFNNTVAGLRRAFDRAIESGVRRSNPTKDIKRLKPSEKDLGFILPDREQFHNWVKEIRNGGGRFSKASADFVEFLAYSGLRKSEAKHVMWKHCDFERGEIIVLGPPEEGTKNSEIRRIPIIPPMKDLLDRVSKQLGKARDSSVCRVNEAQKSMDRAAEKVKMKRITHHDLRHLFATTCIESGVDIPTLSRWLGHKDGGVLAMKTYGHLRNEHSQQQANKVTF